MIPGSTSLSHGTKTFMWIGNGLSSNFQCHPNRPKGRQPPMLQVFPTAMTLGKAPDLDPKTKEDLVDHFLHLHKVACQELESLGVDACDRYRADKAIFVLQAVTKNS